MGDGSYIFKSLDEALRKGMLSGSLYGIRYERENHSENYVEIPPALLITDRDGDVWGLGNEYIIDRDGYHAFNVLRNDRDMDEVAQKIVYKRGRVYIYASSYGWKHWSRHGKAFI